jgi:polyphenol oxidase
VIRLERPLPDGSLVVVRFSGTADGDLAARSPQVEQCRAAIDARPWTWLEQEHGAAVVTVTAPGGQSGSVADASVTTLPDAVLAVQVADCAPVMLWSDEGVVAVAHAGWRGLVVGVLGRTVTRMRELGAGTIRAVLGPCIRVESYAFSAGDLDRVAAAVGDVVRGRTRDGQPALDIPAAVRACLASAGVDDLHDVCTDTATSPGLWSWRASHTQARQAGLVVREL